VAVDLLPPQVLTFDVLARVAQTSPALLCLGAVVPGGVPHLRYLCKQLRARFPVLPIVVGCWGAPEPVAETVALLRADGLDHIGTTVQTTRDYVMQVRQLVTSQRALIPGEMSDPTAPGQTVVPLQTPREHKGQSEQ
jgi:hypothetical protein